MSNDQRILLGISNLEIIIITSYFSVCVGVGTYLDSSVDGCLLT